MTTLTHSQPITVENNPTPPAEKTFCVYADRRVFQQVEAITPEEAHRLAQLYPGDFEPCSHDIESFEMCPFVMDLESGEDVRVGSPAATCETCGSEIVETVNETFFREGQCGACEYARYAASGELLAAWEAIAHSDAFEDLDDDRRMSVSLTVGAFRRLRRAITLTHGNAA